jgi:hypothetical protein
MSSLVNHLEKPSKRCYYFYNQQKVPINKISIGSAISIETPPVGFFLKFSNV